MPDSSASIQVLLLADSHLGFDLPLRPRVERRRRGHDFLANHERALAPARAGAVDLVVHGGDVFHRSRVPPSLVFQAFRAIIDVAEMGVPVFVVPGNHERSRIPHDHLASHPNVHVFHRPETKVVEVQQCRVALAGFPFQRGNIRGRFPEVLKATGWKDVEADLRLLCLHHCVEGARVGPVDYTFRNAPDVIRCSDLPEEFAAVLSGHIHRHQILCEDLQGRPLPTPVVYPGSIERTAFAERGEEKGFLILEMAPGRRGGQVVRQNFLPLPTRPMLVRDLQPTDGVDADWLGHDLEARIMAILTGVPRDAVLRLRVHGRAGSDARALVAAPRMRQLSPPEMNLDIRFTEDQTRYRREAPRRSEALSAPAPNSNLVWHG